MLEPTSRRDFLTLLSALSGGALLPRAPLAQEALPVRRIPSTGETLPVIGLGSSKVVQEITTTGADPLRQVLRTLVAHGGKLVDTWPRNADNDAAFGAVINEPELHDRLFVTTKIDQVGKEAGIAQFRRTLELYGREVIDLVQIHEVIYREDPTRVFVPGGAIEALVDAKKAGKIRFMGFTGHKHPDIHLAMLKASFDHGVMFDTVQMPLNPMDPHFASFEKKVLPVLQRHGMAVEVTHKVADGERPNVIDLMKRGDIALVFNTPEDGRARHDSSLIRRTAVVHGIPYHLTVDGAQAAIGAIEALLKGEPAVRSLQEYHRDA